MRPASTVALVIGSCAAFMTGVPTRPASTVAFKPVEVSTVVVDPEAMPVRELDIERRVREAEHRVQSAKVEFEREKIRNKRQRRKHLMNALARAKFAKQVRAYGFDSEQRVREMQMTKSQSSFDEATPLWVKKIFM